MAMITDWTEDMSAVFRKSVFTFSHDLAATNMFTDEALIKLIKKHPSELTDVCTMSCLLYTSPSPRDKRQSRMPSSA